MIHAYGEWIGREVFLIRAGEEALVYPMPWKKQVVAQVVRWWEFWKATEPKWAKRGWGYVIFKGLSDEGVNREYIEAAVALSNTLTGLPVRWMQKKPGGGSYWLFQTQGVNGEGKIRMTRKDLLKLDAHDFHTGRDGGNAIDQSKIAPTAQALLQAMAAGTAEVVTIESTTIARKGQKRRSRLVLEVEIPN